MLMGRDDWVSLQSMIVTSVKDWAAEAERHEAVGLPDIAHECRMHAAALMMSSMNYRLDEKPEGGA